MGVRLGISDHHTYEGRTAASRVLDLVRGSILVNTPRAAVILVEEFFRPLGGGIKLKLKRIENRFSEKAETLLGYRNMELTLLYNGSLQPSKCNRHGKSLFVCLIGEVQIVQQDFLNV